MTEVTTARPERATWYARAISRTAAHPSGWFGRVLARIWLTETAAINDHAVALLQPEPGWRVVELGFGPGRTLGRLANAGTTVTGVDVSSQMVALARRRNAVAVREGRIDVHQGDGTDLPLADGAADGALAVHNLYFWPDHKAVLRELARVLRPGARLVIGIRDPELPPTVKADLDVYVFLTIDQIRTLLQTVGFSEVDVVRDRDVHDEAAWVVATRSGAGVQS